MKYTLAITLECGDLMNAREYLGRIKHLNKEISTNKVMLELLEESLNTNNDTDVLKKIKRLKQEIKNKLIYIFEIKKNILKKIYNVNDSFLRTILLNHYINGLTLKDIAKVTNFSYDYIKHLHIKSIIAFEESNKDELSNYK